MKMKFEIKSIAGSGSVLFTYEAETLKRAIEQAAKEGANLGGANLGGADLRGANLGCADLGCADLRGAYLRGAYLRGAYLRGANLGGADLRGAYLGGAYLGCANLGGAYLGGAYLRCAYLRGAELDDSSEIEPGLTWKQYQEELVPALLTAGGKSLADAVKESWGCHSWNNCPMAVAFGVHELNQIPVLYRERARQFIQFFDARMLKKPA